MTIQEYKDWQALSLKTNRYFLFVEAFLDIMSHRSAVILQMLINLDQDDDGWSLCTVDFLQQKGRMDHNKQHLVLTELREKGLIEIARRGNPGRRYVRVLTDVLCERLKPFMKVKKQSSGKQDDCVSHLENKIAGKQDNQSYRNTDDFIYDERQDDKGQEDNTPLTPRSGAVAPSGAGVGACRLADPVDPPDRVTTCQVGEAGPRRHTLNGHGKGTSNGHNNGTSTNTVNGTTAKPSRDDTAAVKLRDTLKKAGRLEGRKEPNLKQWAKQIRDMRARLEGPDRIEEALDWYAAHCQDQYTPKIYCADNFTDRYAAILEQIDRPKFSKGGDDSKAGHGTVPTTKDGEWIVGHFSEANWPKGVVPRLRGVVELSVIEANAFWSKLCKFAKTDTTYLGRFAKWLVEKWDHPRWCVISYLGDIYESCKGWAEWQGDNVCPLNISGKRFAAALRKLEDEYSGDIGRWKILRERLGY
jgi:hypothetical protein